MEERENEKERERESTYDKKCIKDDSTTPNIGSSSIVLFTTNDFRTGIMR